jgi:positive regulator of sigma E activity
MATSPQRGDDHQMPPKKSTVLLLLTIADTTWRLFIPIVGFTVGGLIVDKLLTTKPWLMIVAMLLGTALAIWLVQAQLKKVKQQ